MDLKRHVLPGAERAADPRMMDPHLLGSHSKAGDDLVVVDVGPLGRHVQVDAALPVGDSQTGFGTERRLVLHPHRVDAFHDNGTVRVRVAAADVYPAEQVTSCGRRLRVDERVELLVRHVDRRHPPAGILGVLSSHDRDGLTPVADGAVAEHRLVGHLEAVRRPSGDVVEGEDSGDARDAQSRPDVQSRDPRMGKRAAEGGSPQHGTRRQVRGEGEVAGELGDAVRAHGGDAHRTTDPGPRRRVRRSRHRPALDTLRSPRSARPRRIAP